MNAGKLLRFVTEGCIVLSHFMLFSFVSMKVEPLEPLASLSTDLKPEDESLVSDVFRQEVKLTLNPVFPFGAWPNLDLVNVP